MIFTPTRTAGLKRLNDFLPKAGASYAKLRNYDRGQGGHRDVSTLSPYIRRRAVSEDEVLRSVLARHSLRSSEKFVQEVFWRTYWKGWLELRPSLWARYQSELWDLENQIATQAGLRAAWEEACLGRTGIACFDAWAHELVETGYLHNHARMWFASIWIFTLKLPWQLGADFFLRHLLDGDPASNTLSWRWVGGLQTVGKTYLTRADNIAKFTEGRFHPKGLARSAFPLPSDGAITRGFPPMNVADAKYDRPALLLIHDDNLNFSDLFDAYSQIVAACRVDTLSGQSPWIMSQNVTDFVNGVSDDAISRWCSGLELHDCNSDMESVVSLAKFHNIEQVITNYPTVGAAADYVARLEDELSPLGIRVIRHISQHDLVCWPRATHGFFKFKEYIPNFVISLGLA